jgi:D-alanine-D-alanine ligase
VVSSIRELMERMGLAACPLRFPVLIEEYIEGREDVRGIIGNDKPEALPVVELIVEAAETARRESRPQK